MKTPRCAKLDSLDRICEQSYFSSKPFFSVSLFQEAPGQASLLHIFQTACPSGGWGRGDGVCFTVPAGGLMGSQAGSERAEASSQWFDRGASPLQTPQIAGSITAASADLLDTLHGGRLNQPPRGHAGAIAVASESFC